MQINLNKIVEKNKHRLPIDFDYKVYLEINPDLWNHNIRDENSAILHYLTVGVNQKRKYKREKLIDVDPDFDEKFYISEYPDVKDYYKNEISISLRERMFHHYYHYGKSEGKHKNKIDHENSFFDFHDSINIKQSELTFLKNNLECVCLLTTSREINNGQFCEFLNHLINKTPKNKISKKIDFKIIVNNNDYELNFDLLKLKKIFANVKIINLNLSIKEDLYIKDSVSVKILPKLGLKSGPNTVFFKTIKLCKKYNTTLFLETDCLLGKDWLQRVHSYVKSANGFLISGAIYDGDVYARSQSAMMNHINGGTALYATGSVLLQNLIKLFKIFLKKQIESGSGDLAYDYALKLFIDHSFNKTKSLSSNRKIWQFIYRNYIPTKLIVNYSSEHDSDLHPINIFKKHNYAILHKKPFKKPPKIVYTYYEPIKELDRMKNDYSQEDLINLCAKSWKKNGWRLIVLNHDVAKQHNFYKDYSNAINSLPSVNPGVYDYHCYMRWLAMCEVGGGLMIDYDVINLNLKEDDFIKSHETITGFQGHVPCVVYGTEKQYLEVCEKFYKIANSDECRDIIVEKQHTSDMIMLSRGFGKNEFNKIEYVASYPEIKSLVHCSQNICGENKKSKLSVMLEVIDKEYDGN